METKTELKYEDFAVGQRWLTRNGDIEIIKQVKTEFTKCDHSPRVYPVVGVSGESYTANGRRFNRDRASGADLIELAPEPEPSPVAKTSRAVRDAMLIDEPKMECWRIYDEVSFGGIAIGGPVGKQYVESIEVDPYNKTATLKLDNGELEQVFNINRASYRPVKAEAKETAGEK